jgi:CO/xanthine dehydrogenase Mo-binding subunit
VLRRPVRLVMTRLEDFAATNPAQGIDLVVRLAADADGRLLGLEASTLLDAGAYTDNAWSNFGEWGLTGLYRWPAGAIRSVGLRTNRFGTGNYRAPTGPQAMFALETLIDEIATQLGLDPIDLRLRNLADAGEPDLDGTPWPVMGARECLDAVRRHPLWTARGATAPGEGIGVAFGAWPGTKEPAGAWCRLESDGTLAVITGVADISGALTSLAIIAAETFGLPLDDVRMIVADTDAAPSTPFSAGSAIIYGVGPAVRSAAAEARDRLLAVASETLEIAASDLEIVDGIVRPRDAPERGETVAAFARRVTEFFDGTYAPIEGHASTVHAAMAHSAAAQLVRVRVDVETGEVRVLETVLVQDAGRAIDPLLVEGQAHGGIVQSLGRALVEELVHDGGGALVTGSFLDYALPRASMVPPIEVEIVEVAAPEGPFGARGVGESSVIGGPAAVANAIAAATGVRLRELPMTPRRVWASLQSSETT